jgi:P-type Cu2+ transporter
MTATAAATAAAATAAATRRELARDTAQDNTLAREACFHCGEPASAQVRSLFFGGSERRFCCVGCHAVAEAVIGAGLDDFYRQRTGYSARPPEALATPSAASESDAQTQPASDSEANTSPHVSIRLSTTALYLNNLTCTACAWLATHTLTRMPGVHACDVNFSTATAYLQVDSKVAGATQLVAALARVGLVAELVDGADRTLMRAKQKRRELIEFGVAALSMMQVMMLAVPLYLTDADELAPDTRALLFWGQWIMTLPALFISARPLLAQAWRVSWASVWQARVNAARVGWWQALQQLQLTMDVPIALALVLTFVMSTVALFTGEGHLYFDAITMFVFLILGARLVESSVRRNATARIQRMANPRVEMATRLSGYPNEVTRDKVTSSALSAGDVIEITAGELVAADGEIIDGQSEVDEALMTGESRPILKRVGDTVLSGTVNQVSPIIVRVTAAGPGTTLAQLARRVEATLSARTALSGIAEHVARWVTPITLLLALAGGLLWLALDATRAFDVVVAILAVTCPCALALAVPATRAAALSSLAKQGLLVTNPAALDALRRATDIVFDKTGTVTAGKFDIAKITLLDGDVTENDVLRIAAALEAGSTHPIATAIIARAGEDVTHANPTDTAHSIAHLPGLGVTGTIGTQCYRLGTLNYTGCATFAETNAAKLHVQTIVALAAVCQGGNSSDADAGVVITKPLAIIALQDTVRPYVADAMRALAAQGKRIHLASGDSEGYVSAVAAAVGVAPENVRARQRPTDKQTYIEQLKSSGGVVVAVGDGVNDTLMLAAADVGIGLATGSTLTKLSADIVIDERKHALFNTIEDAFTQASRSHRVTVQNLGWAALYNAIALPLAFAGLVTPLIAAIGMAASSLIVVLNAARLSRSQHAVAHSGAR